MRKCTLTCQFKFTRSLSRVDARQTRMMLHHRNISRSLLQIFRTRWRDFWKTIYWCSERQVACCTSCRSPVFTPFCQSTSKANFACLLIMRTWSQVIIAHEHASVSGKGEGGTTKRTHLQLLLMTCAVREMNRVRNNRDNDTSRKIEPGNVAQDFAAGYPSRLRRKVDNLA